MTARWHAWRDCWGVAHRWWGVLRGSGAVVSCSRLADHVLPVLPALPLAFAPVTYGPAAATRVPAVEASPSGAAFVVAPEGRWSSPNYTPIVNDVPSAATFQVVSASRGPDIADNTGTRSPSASTPVPEPGSMAVFAVGALAVAGLRKRR